MKPEKRKYDNGKYIMVYAPDHHRAYKDGYVYEHVICAEKAIGRSLRDNEHVHHLNDCPLDNRPQNLLVLEKGQHTKIHNFIRRHNLEKLLKKTKTDKHLTCECEACGEYLSTDRKFCDNQCYQKYLDYKRENRPSLEELQELLDQGLNKVEIGGKFGVHRSTVNSWLYEYGVDLSVK